jgi:hypothetical protein
MTPASESFVAFTMIMNRIAPSPGGGAVLAALLTGRTGRPEFDR